MHRAGHMMSWITAFVIALSPTVFADEPRPDAKKTETRKPQPRRLKGRDVAMLLWMPFAVFGMDLDPRRKEEKPIKKTGAQSATRTP